MPQKRVHLFRVRSLLLALLMTIIPLLGVGPLMAQTLGREVALTVDGRPFNLFTPAGLEARKAPLVLVLHGGLSSADRMQDELSLFREASRGRFRVAYLDGTLEGRERANRRTWNAGDCCSAARDLDVNDVAYIANVISTLTARGLTDPKRVFLVGHSNGAMMSYRFACSRSHLIGGVVGLAGVLVTPSCPNASGVRILHIHGHEDQIVPIRGGGAGNLLAGAPFRPVSETTNALRAGGARVETLLITGADHGIGSIDRGMRATFGRSVAEQVRLFVQGR